VELFKKKQPLSEDIGEAMARWAAGESASGTAKKEREERGAGAPAPLPAAGPATDEEMTALLFEIEEMASEAALDDLAAEHRTRGWSKGQGSTIKAAIDAQRAKLKAEPEQQEF